jgi:hypothetical protein
MKTDRIVQQAIMAQESTNQRSAQLIEDAMQRSAEATVALYATMAANLWWKAALTIAFQAASFGVSGVGYSCGWDAKKVDLLSKVLGEAPRVLEPVFGLKDLEVQKQRDLLQQAATRAQAVQQSTFGSNQRLTNLLMELSQLRNPLQ